MYYVIKREDGKYLAASGAHSAYTDKLQNARTFRTRERAEHARCPGNEYVVSLEDELLRPEEDR